MDRRITEGLRAEGLTEGKIARFRLYNPDNYEDFLEALERGKSKTGVSIAIKVYKSRILTSNKRVDYNDKNYK